MYQRNRWTILVAAITAGVLGLALTACGSGNGPAPIPGVNDPVAKSTPKPNTGACNLLSTATMVKLLGDRPIHLFSEAIDERRGTDRTSTCFYQSEEDIPNRAAVTIVLGCGTRTASDYEALKPIMKPASADSAPGAYVSSTGEGMVPAPGQCLIGLRTMPFASVATLEAALKEAYGNSGKV